LLLAKRLGILLSAEVPERRRDPFIGFLIYVRWMWDA
jgi:hypothetical protein